MTRKPTHPIRKLRRELDNIGDTPSAQLSSVQRRSRAIARHVEPLLAALEETRAALGHGKWCLCSSYCRLIAEWRKPL